MTELDLIIDLHANSERQGPGSKKDTIRALELIRWPEGRELKTADLGCGTGGQTITLAECLNGQIIAVDLFSPFLEKLNERAQKLGLNNKITTLVGSMDALPFEKNSLDLIWSEGAIYNIGFENGIKIWREYLREGAYLAVSEITWITHYRPVEIETYWKKEYPEMDTASGKIGLLENNGFSLSGYFYLEPESWIANYYEPMETGFNDFLGRHNHSELAKKVVRDYRKEIDIYGQFKEYFSYGFYIARKL